MPCETCPKEGCETRSPGLSHVCNLEFWEIQVFEPPHAGSDTFSVGATCHFKGTQPQNSGVNSNTELPSMLHRESELRAQSRKRLFHGRLPSMILSTLRSQSVSTTVKVSGSGQTVR